MFVDRVTIEVQAGWGGDGAISFLREAYRPRGGPDGGDGGNGGSVILLVDTARMTLRDVGSRRHYRAEPGKGGGGRKCTGRGGKDVVITVPAGTLVIDPKTSTLVADLTSPGERFVLAQGGKGGRGNASFADALNQAPRMATKGTEGAGGTFHLELKLIAEVGLVGLPNAGKSTFLSRVTHATPRVAAYPFTTLHPHLGVAKLNDQNELVLADIPGLIEGASQGKGLGDEFLRHVERTRLLLHMVDATGGPDTGGLVPTAAYKTIRQELEAYEGADLASKPEVVALNKVDAVSPADAKALAQELSEEIGKPVHLLSGVSGQGSRELLLLLRRELNRLEEGDQQTA